MNFRLIRLSIHVKNVRAKITRERMYTFQNNRGEKRAMFTESLLCADAALGELSPWSSASGLFFFYVHFTDGKVEALRARGACQGSPAPG